MENEQHIRAAVIDDVAFGKREITLLAVPYNEEVRVPDWRPHADRESFLTGSFDGIESRASRTTLNRDHSRERVIGAGISFDTKYERGLLTKFKVSKTLLGDESLQLAADGALFPSIQFAARSQDMAVKDGVMRFYRAFLTHVALTPEPAYENAAVVSVRSGEPIESSPTPNLDLAAALLREIDAR